jgi:tetratricopeptide (TPR) repeat protein
MAAALSPTVLAKLGLPLACVLLAAGAGAQAPASAEPSPDDVARELYQRSERAYEEGDYEQAIQTLKRAYELSPRRGLLYNLANALERLGRYEEAMSYLGRYAADAPEPQRAILAKRVASLEARATEQRRESRVRATTAPAWPQGGRQGDGQNRRLPEAERVAADSRLAYLLGGVGVASIGAGVLLGVSAHSARRAAERLCVVDGPNTLCPTRSRSRFAQAGHQALAADITWGAGAAALGAALYLVLRVDADEVRASALRVTPASGGVGLSLNHAF